MKNLLYLIIAGALGLWLVWHPAAANVASLETPEYRHWLEQLKIEMKNRGISPQTVDRVLSYDFYNPDPEVVKHDRRQVEFVLTSTQYLNRMINRRKVEEGRRKYAQLRPLFKKIEQKYGVPGNYLVAFWGLETNYGANFGNYNIIGSLMNLSYDKRRSSFFKNELYQALKIIDDWQIDFTRMQGSWAGAMGHFQFMPSTFNAYAVDFNQDGAIDIWRSFEDAAASAANYLGKIGWNRYQPWGMEVSLPWNFDFALAGRRQIKTVREWKKIGVKTTDNRKLPLPNDWKGSIIVPEGKKGSAYLILNNFRKIMNWNRSENYALAVARLADYIANDKPYQMVVEDPALRLKTDDIMQIQSFINKLGWFRLDEDGQLGSQTREAVKEVQKKAGLPADGYPDWRLLDKIRRFDPEIGFAVPVPQRKLHKPK